MKVNDISHRSALATDNSDVHLNMSDISIENPQNPTVVKFKIKASKTDQLRKKTDYSFDSRIKVFSQKAGFMNNYL